ncbi:hypothetical protein K466DRAFT_668601 [Polyporus arcularius HHB13444]|uniref:Uncharacterized protein n=1 Tax=Polyporus arcularius HHB13444 TaxID=1314778 RepID=A0A5C3NPH3_9APHY|nr:hypothetical protein K466DRAFT_668601 [Polyporus arcularius HHB13444]
MDRPVNVLPGDWQTLWEDTKTALKTIKEPAALAATVVTNLAPITPKPLVAQACAESLLTILSHVSRSPDWRPEPAVRNLVHKTARRLSQLNLTYEDLKKRDEEVASALDPCLQTMRRTFDEACDLVTTISKKGSSVLHAQAEFEETIRLCLEAVEDVDEHVSGELDRFQSRVQTAIQHDQKQILAGQKEMLVNEELRRQGEEQRREDEELRRKDEELRRKDEELRRKDEELRRKDEELRRKDEEQRRKDEEGTVATTL